MQCPYCAVNNDRVVDSRPAENGTAIRRRRHCAGCGQRYNTFERVEHAPLSVQKRSGTVQHFDPERVTAGIFKATANLDIDPKEVTNAAAKVEATIRSMGLREVPSDVVGRTVLDALRELHPVAYMRFASVVKSFTSAEDFAKELAALDQRSSDTPDMHPTRSTPVEPEDHPSR